MKRIELTNEDAAIMGQISEFECLSYKEAHENDVMNDVFLRWESNSIARVVRLSIEKTMKVRGYDIRPYEIV